MNADRSIACLVSKGLITPERGAAINNIISRLPANYIELLKLLSSAKADMPENNFWFVNENGIGYQNENARDYVNENAA